MPFGWGFDISRQAGGGASPATEASLKAAVLLYSWTSTPHGSDWLDGLVKAGKAVRTDDARGRTGWRHTVTAGDLAPHLRVTRTQPLGLYHVTAVLEAPERPLLTLCRPDEWLLIEIWDDAS